MRQILPFVNINGKIVDQKSAQISIFNEGFLYGKGIFTTIKVREGYPLFLDRHLNRLETSARHLNISAPFNSSCRNWIPAYAGQLSTFNYIKAAYATIKKNKLVDGGIRITITPTAICIHAFTTKQFNNLTIQQFNNETIKLITTPDTRDIYKTHKVTYRIPHLLARKKARSQGAEDALFTQNKEIIESTYANIFAYTPGNIITPPIKGQGLNGITRQILMENLPIHEQDIPTNTTNPLILVNSLSLKVVENINGRKIKQDSKFINLIRNTLNKAEKTYIENYKLKIH